jgi:diaminohydroxyphosphoribosylaminopyrimidine deaminase/5-amino-6-(5-phosphoribosylamino)uracil reductase
VSAAGRFDEHDGCALRRAVELALQGRTEVEPNPPVGAVVHRSGELLAEGFHRMYGEPHAEVEALRGLESGATAAARGEATLVVTLEPCSSSGKKTPPCVPAILRSGIHRVVVGEDDPDPRHAGRGLRELAEAGVVVVRAPAGSVPTALLADFRAHLERRRPWTVLKWACGLDGSWSSAPPERWISGEASRAEVHRLRGHVDAIVVGAGTVRSDDPLLTARPPGPRDPIRVVIDRRGRVPATARVFQDAAAHPVLWFTQDPGDAPKGVERVALGSLAAATGTKDGAVVEAVGLELRRRGAARILVEGGPTLAAAFLRAHAVDHAWVFVAAKAQGGADAARLGGADASLEGPWRPRVLDLKRCGDDAWFKLAMS